MEELENSLGRRGPELFLLYGEGVSLYQTCSGSLKSTNYIVGKIAEITKSFQPVALKEYGVSFALSFMLAFMGFSRTKVNNALGTGLSKPEYEARAEAVRAHRPTAPVGKTQTRTSDRSPTPTSTATPQGRPDPSLNNSERPMPWPDSKEQAATSAADIRVDQRSPDATTMLTHAAHRSGNQHDDDPWLTTAETGSPDTGMDLNDRKGGAGGLDRYGTSDVWMGYSGWYNATGRIDDIMVLTFDELVFSVECYLWCPLMVQYPNRDYEADAAL
ncbi:hypothetical protein DL771_009404 [Monosporascus sp. 5C6A]|nr:hypothetical protein DL771_009404 [Monosporascus sp. 5C6A]